MTERRRAATKHEGRTTTEPVRAPKAAKKRGASTGRARLDVEERRAQLVTLGLELFGARPYDDVSIDELAAAAGISKGLLYHYFSTKRDFYAACVRESAKHLLAVTDIDRSLPPDQRLAAGLDALLAYVERHGPAYATLLRGVGNDAELAKIIDDTREELAERLLAGMPLTKPSPLVRTALRGFVGFVEAASLEWVEAKGVSRKKLRETLVEILAATIAIATRSSG
jgi:AcrR family transcriptional regulator